MIGCTVIPCVTNSDDSSASSLVILRPPIYDDDQDDDWTEDLSTTSWQEEAHWMSFRLAVLALASKHRRNEEIDYALPVDLKASLTPSICYGSATDSFNDHKGCENGVNLVKEMSEHRHDICDLAICRQQIDETDQALLVLQLELEKATQRSPTAKTGLRHETKLKRRIAIQQAKRDTLEISLLQSSTLDSR